LKTDKKKDEKKKSDKNLKKNDKSSLSADDKDHEILQLDNLFLTVRESLVSKEGEQIESKGHSKSKNKSKHSKKKTKKSKKKSTKKGKRPKRSTLLQLESNISSSALESANQKTRLRSLNQQKMR
jgi:hypothetical protein